MGESRSGYVFNDVDRSLEIERLRSIESIFDAGTERMLANAGLVHGASCLEVGAGAGSIARWLHSRVGDSGHVEAVDLDVQFLGDLPRDIRVTRADMSNVDLSGRTFDVIHARFVLIHNANAEALLDRLLAHLTPEGYLALEEPDFASACPFVATRAQKRAFDDVNAAIQSVFEARGQHYAFGATLPQLLQDRGARLVTVQRDSPVVRGGSPMARMMAMSTTQLKEKYLQTGHVGAEALARYAEFAADPSGWALHHSTMRVVAKSVRAI